jgi:indole-3-glycerol phosphate synthase
MSAFIDAVRAADTPLIMEVKRATADGADLMRDRPVRDVVETYRSASAACLSVVTGRWFGGSTEMLREVVRHAGVPVLQKDFITRADQIARARDLGASAVLLTARLLPAQVLGRLIRQTLRQGLTPFVEVVDEAELAAVVHGDECAVAVNNKDIRRRERDAADLGRSLALLPAVAATGTPCPVSASGIDRPAVAARLVTAGYAALLVGTALLRTDSPAAWVAEFGRHRAGTGNRQ